MPTSVALGTHFEEFVKVQVSSGRYNNVSEVVRDGLRLLQDQEDLRCAKLEWLRTELQKGLSSGPVTPLDMAEVRAEGQRLRAQRLAADQQA
ncbi:MULTISPECIES: type II toxin-antitoxin system ParD family antitoxin [unclassified Thiomonas]|uniref:type II toxin-antitoxin system ParD family antitoxin n=1 Tax=unclassified Thiomonas TaxID=2625466 RepID=UPI0004DBB088|nr:MULTISPECIES: type II toxin-antitoxin system ParD family antitoxin [unclassified Thiomonas]CDW96526.1 Antitoxin ParD1 [Thiomonas sp. CB2]SCC95943.1 Antitoxin ParD1 [Thiomonas sp. X19]VDY15384.1 Antitoxin ParD1 [Thiomonas sp. OC7]VDY19349.1 Antitoxin ParD1 [Thiomonas sp. CB2]